MNIENTQAQMRKGILEYCILLIIARQDAYVQDIITQLKASRMPVVEGTVYPLLTRKEIANPYIFRDSQCDIYSDTFINEVFTMKNCSYSPFPNIWRNGE